jgi:hypothetical protein
MLYSKIIIIILILINNVYCIILLPFKSRQWNIARGISVKNALYIYALNDIIPTT